MQNTKIIQFLKSLSKQEIREFGKFVRSTFHNNRKDVIRFYDVLKKYHPDFSSDEISMENIHKELYTEKKYDSNDIILLNSYLYNLGKEFLTILDLKQDTFFSKYHFLKNLDKHNSDSLFEKEYKYAEDFLNNEKLNKEFFSQKSLLEELKIDFNLKRNRQDKIFQNTIDYCDYSIYFFIVNLVIMHHDMLVDKRSFNYKFTDSAVEFFIKNFNFEEFIKKLKIEKIENHNYLLFYYYLFMCNLYPENERYYLKLKEYLFKDFEKLHIAEKSARFHYIIDYCLFKLKSGNSKFLRESFNLYTEGLKKKLYKTDSRDADMGLIFFRNFVVIGLAAEEYDYVEKFISEYGRDIKGNMRDDTLELSYAMLYYEKKEYSKALECLNKVSGVFPLFKLSTKHILIKIYYETNQYDSFFSLMDTYKHYLKNEKIITDLIRGYHINFLNYLGILVKIKSSGTHDNLFPLKKEIKQNVNMDFRHQLWLIEKAEELEKMNIKEKPKY